MRQRRKSIFSFISKLLRHFACNLISKSQCCSVLGLCQIRSSKRICSCKDGFIGQFCQYKTSNCADLMCLNGGTCSIPNSDLQSCECSRCHCHAQFSGPNCEILNPIVVVKEQALSTSQWIGISFGSGLTVVLLILTAACLLHYRKKSISRIRTKTPNPAILMNNVDEVRVNKVDSIVVVQDNAHRNSLLQMDVSEVPTEMDCWQSQALSDDNISHENNAPNSSKRRSSARMKMLSEEQSLRRKSHQLRSEFNADTGTTVTNNFCNATQQRAKPSISHSSRLPTYEEVCKENDFLLQSE